MGTNKHAHKAFWLALIWSIVASVACLYALIAYLRGEVLRYEADVYFVTALAAIYFISLLVLYCRHKISVGTFAFMVFLVNFPIFLFILYTARKAAKRERKAAEREQRGEECIYYFWD